MPAGPTKRLHIRAGGEHAAHRRGLVDAEFDPDLGQAGARTRPRCGWTPARAASRWTVATPTGPARCARARRWRTTAAPGPGRPIAPLASRSSGGRRRSPGRAASNATAEPNACIVSPSNNSVICRPVNEPKWSGNASLIARVRSGAVHAAFFDCTSASAASITASRDQRDGSRCCPVWFSTWRATPARPPATSARNSRSQRSRRCSTVSPSCDFAFRVANVAWRCNRSSSRLFGARPNFVSNAITSVAVRRVIARRRELNRSITSGATPTTSRALPSGRVANRTPNARVRCSSVVRSPTAAAAPRNV